MCSVDSLRRASHVHYPLILGEFDEVDEFGEDEGLIGVFLTLQLVALMKTRAGSMYLLLFNLMMLLMNLLTVLRLEWLEDDLDFLKKDLGGVFFFLEMNLQGFKALVNFEQSFADLPFSLASSPFLFFFGPLLNLYL